MKPKRRPRALTLGKFKLEGLKTSILFNVKSPRSVISYFFFPSDARRLGEWLITMADWIERDLIREMEKCSRRPPSKRALARSKDETKT